MKRLLGRVLRGVAVLAVLLLVAIGALVAGSRPAAPSRPNPSGDVAPAASGAASGAFTLVSLADLKARPGVLLEAYDDARARSADLVVIGGDLVQFDSDFEYAWALKLLEMAPRAIPLIAAFGNHEAWDRFDHLSRDRFRATFGPTQGWLRAKGVLVVWADTADYDFPEDRAREVDAMLAAERPRSRKAILVTHELPRFDGAPPLHDKRGYDKQLAEPDSLRMRALVEKHDVALVIGGHFHGYAEGKVGRAKAIVSGGGGAPLDGPDECYHYVRVTLDDAGVTHEVVKHPDNHGPQWARYLVLQNAGAVAAATGGIAALAGLIAWVLGRGTTAGGPT